MPKGVRTDGDESYPPANPADKGHRLDELDIKILELMLTERESKNIASSLEKPLSTIQRRMRLLTNRGIIKMRAELDYSVLGLSTGLLHVYLHSGEIERAMEELLALNGITSTAAHIGNSDIVCNFVFRDGMEVMKLISKAKGIKGVDRVVWSQEIYAKTKPLELVEKQVMQAEKSIKELEATDAERKDRAKA